MGDRWSERSSHDHSCRQLKWRRELESEKQPANYRSEKVTDAREHARVKLEVDVKIYSRSSSAVLGHTVDISEAGLAALAQIEVSVDQVVRLEFKLQEDRVSIRALVRYRNAFRYGFQFVEPDSDAQQSIVRFCRERTPCT